MSSANTSLAADSDIRLVKSDGKGLIIEITTPEYKIVQKKVGKLLYDEIVISKYGNIKDIGKPILPIRGALIGIPEKGGININVTASDYKAVHLEREIAPYSLPAKGHTPRVLDKNTYEADSFYPGHLATEGFTRYIRDQRVKQILFYPVQYNPFEREIRIYKHILIEVTFEKPFEQVTATPEQKGKAGTSGTKPPLSSVNEKLLKDSLLNYNTLPR